jgi:hypothetical protein
MKIKHGLLIKDKEGNFNKENLKFCQTFFDIKARCNKDNVDSYKYAGARGIKCEWNSLIEFKDDMFKSFMRHIKNNSFRDTTIDRINVDGNYCKENCRWATQKTQSTNKRTNRMISFKGKIMCARDWEKELNLYRNYIYNRCNVFNETPEEALSHGVKFRQTKKYAL